MSPIDEATYFFAINREEPVTVAAMLSKYNADPTGSIVLREPLLSPPKDSTRRSLVEILHEGIELRSRKLTTCSRRRGEALLLSLDRVECIGEGFEVPIIEVVDRIGGVIKLVIDLPLTIVVAKSPSLVDLA